jgi:hypothetical protein
MWLKSTPLECLEFQLILNTRDTVPPAPRGWNSPPGLSQLGAKREAQENCRNLHEQQGDLLISHKKF